ncbi:small nuclear ribonucleoprotein SmG [Penicillium argentinense]|uniref:Sm protein G n=1 Tax=Penicillium argentinense TaxID=1131581 RepID=A0A9W9EPN4_9EURO|nr:small nuclear ribonucleoprotein SmG [Penicillium argentinense]KAJ5085509.1 small nuclear ribonucleoprotein SmG [Penicillium argentinense]
MPKGQPELKKVSSTENSDKRIRRSKYPDLIQYVGKRVIVKMNADRTVTGILVGFDVRVPLPISPYSLAGLHRSRENHVLLDISLTRYDGSLKRACEAKGLADTVNFLTTQSFMNLSMHECNEEFENGETLPLGQCVLRGNSIKIVEAVDRVHASGN